MKHRTLFLFIILLVLSVPTICSAEWKQLEGKFSENTYGTKLYIETKMGYADTSSDQTPIVVFWTRNVFSGKTDPVYVKLVSIGGSPDITTVEMKFQMDINKKTAATLYGILSDAQGRILSTDGVKKPVYTPISPDSAAELVWAMIKDWHEKGAISK
jgi:hypothetical protein